MAPWLVAASVTTLSLVGSERLLDPINMPKLAFLCIVVAFSIGVYLMRGPSAEPMWTRLWVPAACFCVPLLIAWALSPYRSYSFFGRYQRYQGLVPYLAVIALGLIVCQTMRNRERLLAIAVVVAGVVAALFGLHQMLTEGFAIGYNDPMGWVPSTFGHSNFAGGFFAISISVAVVLWVRGLVPPAFAIGATAVIACGWIFSMSQGAWVAGICGLAVGIGLASEVDKPRLKKAGLAVAAALAGGAVVVTVLSLVLFDVYGRAPGILGTVRGRGLYWQTAISVAGDSPFVGNGPDTFSIEGPLHRPARQALAAGHGRPDDPHSVPLAMLANGGILMAAGWVSVLVWAVARARRRIPGDALTAAFCAGLAAYVAQALFSIDQIALRATFWVCLAGLALRTAGDTAPPPSARRPALAERLVRLLAGLVAIAAGLYLGLGVLLAADRHAARGYGAFLVNRPAEAIDEFAAALRLRADQIYLRVLATGVANAALDADFPDADRDRWFARADDTYDRLHEIPDASMLSAHGNFLLEWTLLQEGEEHLDRAEALIREAMTLDPNNAALAMSASGVLIAQGRYDEAVELLDVYIAKLDAYPAFRARNVGLWGAKALTLAVSGDEEGARAELETAEELASFDCRAFAARMILAGDQDQIEEVLGPSCPAIVFLLPDYVARAVQA